MFNVGCPSGKTLYQLQAERLLRLQQLVELKTGKPADIPWKVDVFLFYDKTFCVMINDTSSLQVYYDK
jgi:hypothetical protein